MTKKVAPTIEDVKLYAKEKSQFTTDELASAYGLTRRGAGGYVSQLRRRGDIVRDEPATADGVSRWSFVEPKRKPGPKKSVIRHARKAPRSVKSAPKKDSSEFQFAQIVLEIGFGRANNLINEIRTKATDLFDS